MVLKKDAHINEMTIENRMVELYHAHTDEDTKLSRHIYSNTLGVTTFSTTNVARDGRSGIAICYVSTVAADLKYSRSLHLQWYFLSLRHLSHGIETPLAYP
jgi:hypothetical protein